MSEKKLEFTIDNTGGVSHAEFALVPGINILKGRNGAGKTSCIDAVVRASGGKAQIQRKDGTAEGRVQGPGVTLTLRKVVSTDGKADLELADVGPLGRLIDPRLKNSDAAARERIRALVELIGVGVDEQKLLALCGGDAKLFADLTLLIDDEGIDNLLEASEKLRHLAHARARTQENLMGAAEVEIGAGLEECTRILETIDGPTGLVDTTIAAASAELEAGIRTHDRAIAKCEAREELEKRQSAIRETLGERPDVSSTRAHAAASAAKLELHRGKVAEVQETFRRLELEGKEIEAQFKHAVEFHDLAIESVRRWDEQNKILEEKPSGPTREELGKLHAEVVDRNREALKLAQISQRFRDCEKDHNEAVVTQKAAEEKSKALRELADGIPDNLGKILADAGAPGLTVIGGRLHVTSPEGPPRDFEHRCSSGERAKAAVAVAAQAYDGRVVALDGEVWSILDPENRAIFAAAAQANDICVITEEPALGELRITCEPTGADPLSVEVMKFVPLDESKESQKEGDKNDELRKKERTGTGALQGKERKREGALRGEQTGREGSLRGEQTLKLCEHHLIEYTDAEGLDGKAEETDPRDCEWRDRSNCRGE